MKELKKIRIAIIGLGDIAQKAYLPILANHTKVSPILCTRNMQVLKQLATQYRINDAYTSLDELIKNKPDAAMVNSSTNSHFIIVSKLLNAGIPVFVDKPLSYSLHESEELLNLATKKQISLYLGFNRRFAPLINLLEKKRDPIQVFWLKNRVNLPGDPRTFVFDDFIHVADSLRFLSHGSVENIQVFSKSHNNQLEMLQVQWQQNKTLLNGAMNRVSGISEESVAYYTVGNKWQINELVSGFHYQNEIQHPIGFDNWKSTLYKRGFINLVEDWLYTLQTNKFDKNRIQDIWETHNLCEIIVEKILKKNHKYYI